MSFQHLYHLPSGDKSVRILGLNIWNYLPDTFEAKWSFQTFNRQVSDGLDLSTSIKLAVIWIILDCYYRVDLFLDSI